jgi:hypothetical protein
MLLFLAADGDGLTKKLNQAKTSNNIEEIRRISNNISKGNALFASFALRALGSTIEEQGDEILIDFDAAQLSELESIRKQYVTVAETTVSVGIGKKVSEAVRALLAAKLKGGNCSVFYDKDVEKEIKEAEASTQESRVKTVSQYLAKAQENFQGGEGQHTSNMDAPALNTLQTPALPLTQENDQAALQNNTVPQPGQVQGDPEALQPQANSTPSLDISHFEQEFKNHANNQETAEKANNLKTSEGYNEIKKQVAEALINIKNQMSVISSLRTQAPDTYEAIMGVIRGIIMLGREISNTDDKIEKAESLIKGIVSPIGVVHNVEAQSDGDTSLGIAGSDALDKDETPATNFDQEQLAIGAQIEIQEHGLSLEEAQKIATDHLTEDPNYYKKETQDATKEVKPSVLAKTEFFFDPGNGNLKQLQYDGPAEMSGRYQKHMFVNPTDNTKYVFKQVQEPSQAIAAESASRLAEAVLPIHQQYPVRVQNLVGHVGVTQPVISGAHDLSKVSPQELTVTEVNDLFGEFLIDFLVGNAATDGRKLLRTVDGNILGIDKKDSYKDFINVGPYYQSLLGSVECGLVKIDQAALDSLLAKVINIPHDEYLDNVGEYAQGQWPGSEQLQLEFCKQLLSRKQNIQQLFTDLIKQNLQKGERPEYGKMRGHIQLPVGSQVFGKIKVRHWDGSESWKSIKAGAIRGLDPGMAGEGHPVSAKNPAAK